MSIRLQFFIYTTIVSSLVVCFIGFSSFKYSKEVALTEAVAKVAILSSYTSASKHFFRTESIPMVKQLMGKDRFYPELMSGFAISRQIAENFQKKQPDYMLKNATIDPLWQENKANRQELEVIHRFNVDSSLTSITGLMTREGQQYYYEATPQKVEKKCLRCHGDPNDAPKDQIMIYGEKNGYHWKLGETVSGMFIYVPVSKALAQAKDNALKLVGMSVGGLALAITMIVFFLGYKVVSPIEELVKRSEEVSLGKNLDKTIDVHPNREIASLSRAVDRLRLSINRFMKR